MSHLRPWHALPLMLVAAFGALAWFNVSANSAGDQRFDGFNVIAAAGHPFGSETAKVSLDNAKALGARAIAIIPFFWQLTPSSPNLLRGTDMTDEELRAGIRDAHARGLAVLVKPHVWVPDSWAGAVVMSSMADWQEWFVNYRRELERIARIAADEKAEALAVGTELTQTTQRREWNELIAAAHAAYSGRLLYFAHNVEEAKMVPFWNQLDAIGVTLYPPLGPDDDRDQGRNVMRDVAHRLDTLATRTGKSILVGEIGIRSAEGAAAKPWEGVEERTSAPDPTLQADVIADWLAALDGPAISGILVWEWSTNPDAGGSTDTNFTVQGKPAARVLQCAWTQLCEEDHAGDRLP